MKKKIITSIILSLLVIAMAMVTISTLTAHAYAIPGSYKPENQPFDPQIMAQNTEDAAEFAMVKILQTISGGLLYFAAPLAIILIVQAGFTLVISGADSEKLGTVKKHLTWEVIGLFLIILSYSIVRILIATAFRAGSLGN